MTEIGEGEGEERDFQKMGWGHFFSKKMVEARFFFNEVGATFFNGVWERGDFRNWGRGQ